ncbi:MAG: hypothetical protein AB1918_16865 [Pseudomonadota bacterium]
MNVPLLPIATTEAPLAISWRLEDDVLVEEGDGWRRLYGRWDKTFGCWTVPLPAEDPVAARIPFEPNWPVLGRHGTWLLPHGPRDDSWYDSRAAIAAYFSLIPLPVRRLVSSFGPQQWSLLEAIWRDPQAAQTIDAGAQP